MIKAEIDQVDRLNDVDLELPLPNNQIHRTRIEVPQVVSWRLHERFRWPSDKVLLLSCGVVAAPKPENPNAFGIPNLLKMGPGRADALLFIEHKGRASQTLVNARTAAVGTAGNRGRY